MKSVISLPIHQQSDHQSKQYLFSEYIRQLLATIPDLHLRLWLIQKHPVQY